MTKRLLPLSGYRFYFCVTIIFFALCSCKKDKESIYADLLHHRWQLKSISKRLIVYGADIGFGAIYTTPTPLTFTLL
jgi:hypothetical protein